jgi:acyl-CoA thioester hydrolase
VTRLQPHSRDAYRHFITITTRWMDNDVYRHVNNVVYYSFFDTTVNQYLMHQGVLDLVDSPVVSLVVDTGCQFFSPVSFPDTVHCGLRVAHLGTRSVRYEIGIFRNDEPLAAAQGHFVHVACDRHTQRPVALPDNLRLALAPLRVTDAA